MSRLYLNTATKRLLDSLKKDLPHGVLLHGDSGVGLSGAANYIAENNGEIITILPEKNEAVDLEKGIITVDVVRRLYEISRSKGLSKVIIIDYAERMAQPAQNAFLKLLEEPNQYTRFILLSHNPERLLPTITSRVQSVKVDHISENDTEDLLDELRVMDQTLRAQYKFVALGLPAEVRRLTDQDYFSKRVETVKDARTFVSGSSYDRSAIAQKYKDNRQGAILLIDDCLKLLKMNAVNKKDYSYIDSADKLLDARGIILGNGNIRLQLSVAL